MIHYPIPVHKQKAYSHLSPQESIPITEGLCNEILSLPLNPWLKNNEIEEVCTILNEFGDSNE